MVFSGIALGKKSGMQHTDRRSDGAMYILLALVYYNRFFLS